jgi:homoserine dehydrogenase
MSHLSLGLAGLGVVGAKTAELLMSQADIWQQKTGKKLTLTAVSARDRTKDRGIDLSGVDFEEDPVALAHRGDIDVVIELIGGSEGPARALVEAALASGKHVVTANKALIAHHGQELAKLAEQHGVQLFFEAAVAGGIPALKVLREGLAANHISRVTGILNGTCNYILTEMTQTGRDFGDVLAEAQAKGFAEADPSFDVDGVDAAHKLAILAALAYGEQIDFSSVNISGIRSITGTDIAYAGELGYVIKLLGIAERSGIRSVQPCLIAHNDQLAKIDGALNAVAFEAEPVQTVLTTGPGAGAGQTSSAVLADVLDIATGRGGLPFGRFVDTLGPSAHVPHDPEERRYYLRAMVPDRAGILSAITSILKDKDISVESMLQRGQSEDAPVALVMTLHPARADAVLAACDVLTASDFINGSVLALPILDRIERH